ncbi:uncharacterized protein CELE_F32D8.11 [Caenorhabditis elegans]|uniref:Uncharacterized protein n=1 Tax=Caenorhabditis elegans TaxID=6239 RepID=D0VWN9_CAEEL|nr:Uncharacterized protein CELE_F32D8.11 [Caenorhabditis elegans]pir/T21661/ hypothetical protein F32D8.11b - Caenorhabditis elegans [Caenorhabditis elegans]CBH29659.1 Uncharacterized protein CELE_F32D8.11 [Caenorhabditis elegans]|eukprot:NP_001256273.1 Uncharacterized protein CELE_F32D8.11 [Caenorhabditis elegans]
MKFLLFLYFTVLAFCEIQCVPLFKDIDYKLYEYDTGVAVDSVFEIVPDTSKKVASIGKRHRKHHEKL